ncbi:diacylglycerol/lipid kinase family protein [Rhizobium sp. RAF56]|uniref:diacylglycerol/lipid kinase family protein n=1 Tax=Rhizobium sp. RAF56 TaxID=3233062 RepID=UPI003F97D848
MRIGAVVNPVSGRKAGRSLWPEIAAALGAEGAELDIRETGGDGDAARLGQALSEDGSDLVIAVGGDGTIGEVASGILRSDRPGVAFSFVPAGTGSDFARNFALPTDPRAYAARLLSATATPVDAGVMTCEGEDGRALSRHFINIASFGVSGPIVRAVNNGRRGRGLPGTPVFFLHSVSQLLRYRPRCVGLRLDGIDLFQGPITAVAVSNGRWFGAGMHVAPAASLSDGLFDVVVIRGAPTVSILKVMNSIYTGAHIDHPLVSVHRASRVEVWPTRADRSMAALIESDGEAPGRVPARFDVLPGAINLRI